MPWQRRPPAPRQRLEAVIEPFREFTNTEGCHAAGGQFDGQRDPIQPAADLGNRRGVGLPEFEAVEVGRPRTLDEELDAGECQSLGRGKSGGSGRAVQWKYSMHALASRPQRLATGRQDVYARGASGHLLGQGSGCLDQVLATVEYQQHLPVPQMGQKAGQAVVGWYRQPQDGRTCARQKPGVRDPRQIEKRNAIGIRRGKFAGDRNSDRGLADTARPDQRDEPSLR